MTASGRKLPFKITVFNLAERPVLVKADIQKLAPELSARNDRLTPESRHCVIIWLKGR